MRQAQLVDGTILEFPDETPDDVIDQVVRQHLAPKKDIGHVEGLAAHGASGMALGFGDELGGLAAAAASYLDPRSEANALSGMSFGDRYSAFRDTARDRMGAYKSAHPALATTAEIGGGIMSPAALKAAGLLSRLKGADLVRRSTQVGGLLGGASGAGYSTADNPVGLLGDTALGAGIGAAAGYALPTIGNKLAQAKQSALSGTSTDAYKNAVQILEKNGIPLTTGQKTGTNWVKTAETTLDQVPVGGKPLQEVRETARRTLQRRLFDMVAGPDKVDHDMLTREALDDLSDTLSGQYRRALGNRSIDIADDAFIDDLANIEAKHSGFVDSKTGTKIKQVIDQFLDKASEGPTKTGEWYQAQRSIFRERSEGTSKMAGLYKDLKTALDDAFARSVGSDVKGNLDARYGQYKQLQSLFDRVAGGAEGAEGFIPPGQLARLAEKNAGTREWKELVRAAAAVLPDRLGNSGTAQRTALLEFVDKPISSSLQYLMMRPVSSPLAAGRGSNAIMNGANLMPGGGLLTNPNAIRLAPSAGILSQ